MVFSYRISHKISEMYAARTLSDMSVLLLRGRVLAKHLSQTPLGMEYRKKKGEVKTELRPSGVRKGIGVKFGRKCPLR